MYMKSVLVTLLLTGATLASDVCWRDSYAYGLKDTRGIHTCPSGWEKSGLLCYPKCKKGYYGVGPVCWSYCPSGWRDDGALCNNRGGWTKAADNSDCPWYDVCGLTFARGCSNCNKYPGTSNHGCTCHKWMEVRAKKTYGRGVGKPLQCANYEVQQGLFCYPKCRTRNHKDFDLTGHVCWERCSGDTPHRCGAICTKDQKTCGKIVASMTGSGLSMALGVAAGLSGAGGWAELFTVLSAVTGGNGLIDLIGDWCGAEEMKLHRAGKCKSDPFKSIRGIITAECLQECQKSVACKFAQYDVEEEACSLFRDCDEYEKKSERWVIFKKKDN